jgi:hypothetical protein
MAASAPQPPMVLPTFQNSLSSRVCRGRPPIRLDCSGSPTQVPAHPLVLGPIDRAAGIAVVTDRRTDCHCSIADWPSADCRRAGRPLTAVRPSVPRAPVHVLIAVQQSLAPAGTEPALATADSMPSARRTPIRGRKERHRATCSRLGFHFQLNGLRPPAPAKSGSISALRY